MRTPLVSAACLVALTATGQFSPDGGQPGSIAIHVDSAAWVGWSTGVTYVPGWLDAADTSLGRIDMPARSAALGPPDGAVASLGDGGVAELRFDPPIADGPGADFVVFENGFPTSDTTGFFELALVEVVDGRGHTARFEATGLTEAPVGPFGELDSRQLDGLAGRFSAPYGVPFDLADLPTGHGLDLGDIRTARLTDVVGTADTAFAKTDVTGAPILDPYPTPFPGGGFDLDAVGVLHDASTVVTAVVETSAGRPERRSRIVAVVDRLPCESALGHAGAEWRDAVTGHRVDCQSPPRGRFLVLVSGCCEAKSAAWYLLSPRQ